jgi:hypothetical protein
MGHIYARTVQTLIGSPQTSYFNSNGSRTCVASVFRSHHGGGALPSYPTPPPDSAELTAQQHALLFIKLLNLRHQQLRLTAVVLVALPQHQSQHSCTASSGSGLTPDPPGLLAHVSESSAEATQRLLKKG